MLLKYFKGCRVHKKYMSPVFENKKKNRNKNDAEGAISPLSSAKAIWKIIVLKIHVLHSDAFFFLQMEQNIASQR